MTSSTVGKDGRAALVTKQSPDVTESVWTECSHTPGPWNASEENVGGGFNIYAGPLRVAHTSIQARVFKPEQRLLGESEAKANGRLVAASPDLLTALVLARKRVVYLAGLLGDRHERSNEVDFLPLIDGALIAAGITPDANAASSEGDAA